MDLHLHRVHFLVDVVFDVHTLCGQDVLMNELLQSLMYTHILSNFF